MERTPSRAPADATTGRDDGVRDMPRLLPVLGAEEWGSCCSCLSASS